MPKWQQAPAIEEEQTPRWMQAEVIDEGGPRSYMSRTLDEINPEGAQRRAGERAYRQSDEYKLDRGRAGLDMKARLGPLGLVYSALDPFAKADQGMAGDVARQGQKMTRGITGSPLEGAAFSFDDEIAGFVFGEDAKNQRRAEQLASRTDTPVTNFAGNLAGGIISPVNKPLMAATGVKTATNSAQLLAQAAKGTKTVGQAAREGFRVGGAGGALYGFGAAEGNASDRIDEAAEGAAWGMVGGAALGAGAGAIGNKLSTGKFLPGQPGADILNMTPERFSRTGAANLLRTALRRSDVPSKDVDGAIGDAINLFQLSGNGGNRPITFAQALERSLEQKGYAQAAGNVKSIFQQLQASRSGQGMSQTLDDMAGSQEQYIASALDDTLGPSTLAAERARIRGDQRAIGDAQDDAINQARSMGGNEAGTPAIRQMVERAEMDPNPTVTSWLNRAARDMGFTQTGAAQGQKPVAAFRNASTADPLGFAKQIVRTINAARKGGAQLDAVTMNLLDEAQTALNAATRSTRGPGGRFGYNKMGSFDEGQQKFRLTYEELDAQTQRFLGLARDPLKRAEFSEAMASAPDQVKNAVRVRIKEDIAAALRSGSVDEVMPYLGGLKQKGLHDDLAAFLGDDGEKISRVLRDVIDEQTWLKATDARRLAPADRTSIGKNPDVKNIYTANPLTRLANKTPIMTTLVGDLALGMGTGTPAVTAAKVIGHLTGPRGASVRQLARTLAARARQAGTAPPNRGTLSRMTPGAAQAAAQGSPQGGQAPGPQIPPAPAPATLRTSQRAPWTPAQVSSETPEIVPRVQTGAQRAADQARQRAVDARQRAADAQARKADAETIRAALVEAQRAEADAKIAETQARNAAKITQAQIKAVAKAAREQVKAAKAQGKADRDLAVREAKALQEKQAAERDLDNALDREEAVRRVTAAESDAVRSRAGAQRVEKGTDFRAKVSEALARDRQARLNAEANVDPLATFEETGHLALNLNGRTIIAYDHKAKNADDLFRQLARVEDDILGSNRDKPEKWSTLTLQLERKLGMKALEREILKGEVPGWRTPAERETAKQFRTMGKVATGAAAATLTGAGAIEGVRQYDRAAQASRAKRIMESPELTKIVQRSLKAVKRYEGRADGKFDGDVQIAVSQFQGDFGLGKTSDPGTLDTATLKKLEEMLVFEGKTKLADEIRDIRLNKLKPKEKEDARN